MLKVLISGDTRYGANRKVIKEAVIAAVAKEKASTVDAEVSVHIVGKRKMGQLVKEYLGEVDMHSVLSFPQEGIEGEGSAPFVNPPDGILRLGDIILCWPQLLAEASAKDIMVDAQTFFLVNHGTLHLLGKHHD